MAGLLLAGSGMADAAQVQVTPLANNSIHVSAVKPSISADSGTSYGTTGIPEPSPAPLALAAAVVLIIWRRSTA